VKAYYEARAREYDDWVYGTGLFAERHRPGWDEERERMQEAVAAMPAARTLDIGCGTGWLTQHLRGEIVGLDASPSMLEVAAERIPDAEFLVGDALERLRERDVRAHVTELTGTWRRLTACGSSQRLGAWPGSSSSSTPRSTTGSSRSSGKCAC
jgi:SAM-dependent methyltransferase